MGVGEDFQKFKNNYQITTEQIASISYRYKRITRQLNTDFWNTNSETAHSLYVGSYGRDTAAKGLSDLDIGFILPNTVYHQYNNHQGNGQSALLQAVKKSIQKTYRTSESFGDGQVVVISFDDNVTFEVLPAFENSSNSWTFPNANNGGSWKDCNPRAEIAAIDTRSALTNKNLKYLGRMMRVCAPLRGPNQRHVDRHVGVSVHRDLSAPRQVVLLSRFHGARFFRLPVKTRSEPDRLARARQRLSRPPQRRVRTQGAQRISARERGDPVQ
ncbi:Nucleotidyltransferase domain-containing protein [Bradyrhizobium yuanmingense]|uniref:Nucleotidyltransferase domain-containing protein n=1 Tax=Bradyrhizobium yuanmingense TaxID=108015 RepID=A0A1C3XIK1_9BRAD|nr:nucleotidyltransferase domain-containing protein [Bradyrhizobium yuanmingense]TWI17845.1 nucleotidyltransferase-like protein [Bradyrhizobium yuanmingense]SCB52112.1 Nucleotidyltransferase domain-containing protein [Bradyrhizobium yuanmingense]